MRIYLLDLLFNFHGCQQYLAQGYNSWWPNAYLHALSRQESKWCSKRDNRKYPFYPVCEIGICQPLFSKIQTKISTGSGWSNQWWAKILQSPLQMTENVCRNQQNTENWFQWKARSSKSANEGTCNISQQAILGDKDINTELNLHFPALHIFCRESWKNIWRPFFCKYRKPGVLIILHTACSTPMSIWAYMIRPVYFMCHLHI